MALLANTLLVVLALIMGLRLLKHHAARPRPHLLWYGVGLLFTAAASVPEIYREVAGSLPTALWWVYWVAACTTVGFLGVGTAYLLSPALGRAALAGVTVLALWVLVATVMTAGPAPTQFTEATFTKAPTVTIKIPFLVQNIAGSIVIIGGALWSLVRSRGLYNVWIILGTLLFAGGGASSGIHNYSQLFYFTQSAGIVLLYAGVAASVAPAGTRTRSPGRAQ